MQEIGNEVLANRQRRAGTGTRAGLLSMAAAAVIGCSAVMPGGVQLSVGDSTMGEVEQRAVVAAVSPDSVTVQGVISTPTPCFALSADRTATMGNLELRIAARPNVQSDQACAQAITQLPYTAVSEMAGTGALRLRVVHTYQGAEWPATTVLDTTVVVP
jgi:hypothetical protein